MGTGSGFIISSPMHIVTNYHVVEGAGKIKVMFLNGEIIEAKVVVKDVQNDVAILKLSKKSTLSREVLRLGNLSEVKLSTRIFTVGFPMSQVLGTKPKYSEGIISSTAGAQDDPRYFQISVPIQPGNSGGPLFNMKGEIVGITTASMSTEEAMESMGAMPQNVNFAIKSTLIKNSMESIPNIILNPDQQNPITSFMSKVKGDIDLEEFLQKIRGNVVLIQSEN